MGSENKSILEQLRRNAVALISLFIAISSLSYNTWRNEQTEDNRNQRVAAFEILMKLGELQQLVFHHHYDQDVSNKGNPRTGWTYVLTVRDLSRVLHPPLPAAADRLLDSWDGNWQQMGREQESLDAILAAIEHVRGQTLALLGSLQ